MAYIDGGTVQVQHPFDDLDGAIDAGTKPPGVGE
jgi:hypothetical protein